MTTKPILALLLLTSSLSLPPAVGAARLAAPTGKPIRAPVTRDTWFSNVGTEADCNLGGSTQLKLKSNQEMSLIDIDPKRLRGRVIQGATLHVHLAGEERLHRVTVSSFRSDWVEGTSPRYAPQKGSSTHRHRRHPDVPWTVAGQRSVQRDARRRWDAMEDGRRFPAG